MIEIKCPETCQYLVSGREHSIARENEIRLKESALEGKFPQTLGERETEAMLVAEWTIIKTQREIYPGIEDSEILNAIENAIRNVETQVTGLIYEHRDYSSRVDDLSQRIRGSLDEFANEMDPAIRLRSGEILGALKYLRDSVESHTRRGDPRSYIRYAAQFYPWSDDRPNQLVVA
jgi:hypothetical protein